MPKKKTQDPDERKHREDTGSNPGEATDRTRPYRHSLFLLLAFGVFLSGCMTLAAAPSARAQDQALFEQIDVVIGSSERQTVLTGFLLGGTLADLAVVHIDEHDARRLRLYVFDDSTWAPRLDAALRPDVLFVDVAHIGGQDRLISYAPGRLRWFNPASATERVLVAVTSNFTPPRPDEIPHVDITRDVNGDGRDDLVVPDVDGFWVFIQLQRGAFADPVKIGPPAEMSRIYGADGYRYDPWSQSRIHEIDYDQDGRSDLVFWSEDHFEVHLQDEQGLFAPGAKTFTTAVAFDSDDRCMLTTADMTGKVLHALTDLNRDGVGDLVVYSLEGERIAGKHSAYGVHFGTPVPEGGTVFGREVGAAFTSDGSIQLGMDRHDFDGDGGIDLLFTTIETGYLKRSFWKSIKGFMGDDVWLDLAFYRQEENRYPDTPSTTRRIALDGAPSHREPGWVPLDLVLRGATHESRRTQKGWPRAFNPTLLLGDVTGDGRADLLIEVTFRALDVFVGVPGPDLFARQPQAVKVVVPHDEEYTWLVDLNKDGKQDVLLHHPFTLRDVHGAPVRPPGTEPHRVTLLIAR